MTRWNVHHAQVLDALAGMPDASFDAVLTDPPYGLGNHEPTVDELIAYLGGAEMGTGGDFMGKDWQVPSVHVWREIHRVLRPGGYVFAFGGSRTGDLISLGIRAARFSVRDTLMWLYGSGFPKSLDVSKAIDEAVGAEREVVGSKLGRPGVAKDGRNQGHRAGFGGEATGSLDHLALTAPATELAKAWDGHGTALKPAYEPIILARKPLIGTVVENVSAHGVGGIAIDACRIATDWSERSESWKRSGHSAKPDAEKIAAPAGNGIECHPLGRWPANVLFDEEAAQLLGAQAPDAGASGPRGVVEGQTGGIGGATSYNGTSRHDRGVFSYGDIGDASRFFYVAKASRAERELGCRHLPKRTAAEATDSEDGQARLNSPRTGAGRTSGARNYHPTVKPVSLDRWLARLLLPPPRANGRPRRILVPYAGSGTEMIGALLAGWDEVVGIEREPLPESEDDFMAILKARVAFAEKNPRAFEPYANTKPVAVSETQIGLFGAMP